MNSPRWHVAAASVRGAGHARTGLPCQDAHQWTARAEGVLIAAVADGAGTAALAEVGAALAAAAAIESLSRWLEKNSLPDPRDDAGWHILLNETLVAAKSAVALEAVNRGVELFDLASTLIVVVARPEFVAAIQVGDGAVIVAQHDGQLIAITRPAQAEYLNETVFLTSAEALATAQTAVWQGELAHLAVLSDGLQMAALRMPGGEPHPGFFTPLFNFLAQQKDAASAQESLVSFLASARMRERTDDDLTLILGTLIP